MKKNDETINNSLSHLDYLITVDCNNGNPVFNIYSEVPTHLDSVLFRDLKQNKTEIVSKSTPKQKYKINYIDCFGVEQHFIIEW